MIGAKHFAEFFGTMILSLGINFGTTYKNPDSPDSDMVKIMCAFFAAISLTKNVSGGQINAAISLGFTIDHLVQKEKLEDDRHPLIHFLSIYLFQIAGASFSCLLAYLIYDGKIFSFYDPNFVPYKLFLSELISTTIFVFVVLAQSENRYTGNSSLSTLIVVITLFSVINLNSDVSGGCVNPSLAVAHFLTRGDFKYWRMFLAYISAEFLGGAIAGLLYTFIYREKVDTVEHVQLVQKRKSKQLEFPIENDI